MIRNPVRAANVSTCTVCVQTTKCVVLGWRVKWDGAKHVQPAQVRTIHLHVKRPPLFMGRPVMYESSLATVSLGESCDRPCRPLETDLLKAVDSLFNRLCCDSAVPNAIIA